MKKQCPYCKHPFHRLYPSHLDVCKNVPSSDELVRMLDSDEMVTTTFLSDFYKISSKYIIFRLKETKWTEKELVNRGYNVTAQKSRNKQLGKPKRHILMDRKQCKCGVLIEEGEELCEWCSLDRLGFKTVKDIYGD